MTNTNELTAKLKATEQHAQRGWREAHEQEARADAAEARISELEARTLTVKLPQGTGWCSDPYNHGRNNGISECAEALREACAAAGIKLQIEGE